VSSINTNLVYVVTKPSLKISIFTIVVDTGSPYPPCIVVTSKYKTITEREKERERESGCLTEELD
jgi:hypothetical protein